MNLPETLITKILSKQCILFLGAGATRGSGGVLGNELGNYIFREIGNIGIEYKNDLAKYTQNLVNHGYRDKIEEIVRSRLASLNPSQDFCNIANVPWKAIYTTNYDDLIEKAYSKQHFYKCIPYAHQSIQTTLGGAEIPLYKINGSINNSYQIRNPLIITLNDLMENKFKNEQMISKLMQDMNDTFIFIGYSFQDKNEIVTDILTSFRKNERWESVKEKYIILPNISEDIKLELQSYRINYISGMADEFFKIIGEQAQKDFAVKLNALKLTYTSNNLLKDLSPQTLQYISDSFDIYDTSKQYATDGRFFYRGGQVNWGIVNEKFDIPRDINITPYMSSDISSTTQELYFHIQKFLGKNKLQKICIKGPAVSGKTTALYRCAYDLIKNGELAMIYRQQSSYKEGLLPTIYDGIKKPFVILVDDIFIDVANIIKMVNESERKQIPVLFILTTRYSDWANKLSNYNQDVLNSFDVEITMEDSFSKSEAINFVNKLLSSGIISESNELERSGYQHKFEKNNNIIEVLSELIDNSGIMESLSNEYDGLCPETQYAYGIVSLIYRYGLKTKWEILQRTIANKYSFTWEDFISKVLHHDAKGNLYEDEIQGSFYILGRHRYICEKIVQIHFAGNYSDEISVFKELINAVAGLDNDEYFIGTLIYSILRDENTNYTKEQRVDLLDHAINKFENKNNSAFINHIKGEYYLAEKNYQAAIRCFDSNIQNELNEEYSMQSLGKSYYYLAKTKDISSAEFRMKIDLAIDKLIGGMKKYKRNESYYAMLFSIWGYLESYEKLSEKNQRSFDEVKKYATRYLSSSVYDKLIHAQKAMCLKDSME